MPVCQAARNLGKRNRKEAGNILALIDKAAFSFSGRRLGHDASASNRDAKSLF